jgi:ABC-type sugar transport system permease subunit
MGEKQHQRCHDASVDRLVSPHDMGSRRYLARPLLHPHRGAADICRDALHLRHSPPVLALSQLHRLVDDQALLGGRFVGLANYEDLLADPVFIGSLGITFGYTAAAVASQMALGLSPLPCC